MARSFIASSLLVLALLNVCHAHFTLTGLMALNPVSASTTMGLRGNGDITSNSGGNTAMCGNGAAVNVSTTRFTVQAGTSFNLTAFIVSTHGVSPANAVISMCSGASPVFPGCSSTAVSTNRIVVNPPNASGLNLTPNTWTVMVPSNTMAGPYTLMVAMELGAPNNYYECIDVTVTAAAPAPAPSSASSALPSIILAGSLAALALF
eukprot:TRINITY_DN223_c0_g1_i1.p1 TRINITY_DN223_c0_g1~~TRINITY_DN223_c0_g1_i1.p1  ORF type:complete len:206 (-),score=99.93 TRINITY_DN223_c0_g1_i1:71-688(-)